MKIFGVRNDEVRKNTATDAKKIGAIADMTGFCDYSTFSNTFNKLPGVVPLLYSCDGDTGNKRD